MGTNITGIGNANAIGFKSRVTGGIYFPPELKDALVGVWSAYGKSNDSTDRNIIKNKIKDRGGDFVISNAAFKLNSGFGGFVEDFTSWDRIDSSTAEISNDGSKIKCINTTLNVQYLFNYINRDISSFKIKISNFTKGDIIYYYRKEDGIEAFFKITPLSVVNSDKVIELPKSYNTVENGTGSRGGFYSSNINIGVTIEQIPSFEGAFVTDGVNDLIKSTKSATEMLDGSNEVTVVSMIHQIKTNDDTTRNNWFFTPVSYLENRVVKDKIGKTGIYGYTSTNVTNAQISDITPILGDKNDYTLYSKIEDGDRDYFTVEGFQNQGIWYASSIAWYWTIIANKVLTSDQINQVIAYFNLDKTLKPDILCNITKQGITNDNHADFNDKLIDYSGNGRDIQMNNLAWKGGSGIAAKQYETFKDWLSESSSTSIIKQIDEFTRIVESTTNGYWVSRIRRDSDLDKVYDPINVYLYQDNNFLIHECKYEVDGVKYSIPIYESVGKGYHKLEIYTKDRYTELPENAEKVVLSEWYFPKSTKGSIKYSLIPSYKGGILLDGVNDFGKVTGMPIYKDYTFIADRYINNNVGSVASKSIDSNQYGAFIFEIGRSNYSFNVNSTVATNFNKDRTISYLSKYSYNGENVNVGNEKDSDLLWIGTIRDNDSRFSNGAIYSLMSFPYSMSEFLIERQLKKHKLGTLYPDMVEFRPIVKSNSEYKVVDCYIDTLPAVVGNYYPINSKLKIAVTTKGAADEVTSLTVNGVSLGTPSVNGNRFTFNGTLSDKSPQKINITIDEYIRFEDIVQPYPVLLRFKDENGNEVSWGGKFRVGSTITRIGSAADSNLLPNIYNIFGLLLNDNQVTSSKVIVEKTMVFKAKSAYIFDNNEPKCILSPRLLRIPNSSYKILGYIPDISGHGNHGKINNSAYKLNSGVNGYLVDFTTLKDDGIKGIVRTDSKIYLDKSFNYNQGFWLGRTNNPSPAYKVKVSGIPETGMLTYTGGVWLNLVNGINELPARTNTEEEHGFVIQSPNLDWSNLVIEQIGEYEGAYCLDGVDDFVTIPTVTGGKQVLMKVNWNTSNAALLYDQRGYNNEFAIYNGSADSDGNPIPAYNGRNNGQTYIDGILNSNIKASELRAITHNITITNELSTGTNTSSPVIGSNRVHNAYFTNMALYDFMLFDSISTDDKILELNEYVGIEGNTE